MLKNKKIVILGAGIAGISASYHLNKEGFKNIVFEKESSWGGLCDNFEINGFRFDKFIHLSFTNNKYVKQLFKKSSKYNIHKPDAYNYYNDVWLKHPAQNNIYPLKIKEKIKIIKSFIERENFDNNDIKNYGDWLKYEYGLYFSENFPVKYTRKYWTIEPEDMEISWIGNRIYRPTMDEVLYGAMTEETSNTYYANEMRYPLEGGYKSFIQYMTKDCDIRLNKEVISIDSDNKKIIFSDDTFQEYDILISSLPLPEIVKILKNKPKEIIDSVENLNWTSGALVSLGFNKPDIPKYLWFYIYDEDVLPSRVYSPSLKSTNNVPKGCSSFQAEIYFSKNKKFNMTENELLDHTIQKFIKMNLLKKEDLILKDIRIEQYANVIFDHHLKLHREKIHKYLDEIGINYIGRFGEWDYLWSDQSLISGKNILSKILKRK